VNSSFCPLRPNSNTLPLAARTQRWGVSICKKLLSHQQGVPLLLVAPDGMELLCHLAELACCLLLNCIQLHALSSQSLAESAPLQAASSRVAKRTRTALTLLPGQSEARPRGVRGCPHGAARAMGVRGWRYWSEK